MRGDRGFGCSAVGDSDARRWIRNIGPTEWALGLWRWGSSSPTCPTKWALGLSRWGSSSPTCPTKWALGLSRWGSSSPTCPTGWALWLWRWGSSSPTCPTKWALELWRWGSDFRPKPILFKGISCRQAARKPEQHTPAFLHYFAYSISFISLLEPLYTHFPFGLSFHPLPYLDSSCFKE